jgi:hypothetical protein
MLAILAEAALRSFLLGAVVWLGLTVLRVRNPHVHMTSLVVVLFASLSMPLLMHWGTLTITSLPLPVPAPENFWPIESLMPEPNQASFPSEFVNAAAPAGGTHGVFNWWAFATVIYACVAGLLLLRLAVGIHLTWRLARAAKPTNEAWVADSDVRVSDDVGGPVTFGSTILVPSQSIGWDSRKRQAVLAHEGAHVANRDFYVLLLASLNRAVFWFSPFAWWQLARLAELAEIISDARAIEVLEDRLSYAEILLDLAQNGRVLPAGLEMARACTVRARVERIVAATTVAPRVGWRKRIWIAAAIAPVTVVSAGTIAYRAPVSAIAIDRVAEPATAMQKPEAVEFYSLGSGSIFAVSRAGDDVFGQLTGQRKLRLAATSDGSYSYSVPERQITFPVNAERQSPELKLRLNGRELRAARIADMPRERGEPDTARLDQYVGWYQLAPNRVLTVTRNGDRMRVQETGGSEVEVTANGVDAFSGNHNDLVIFLRDGQARVSQLLLQEPISGARLAPRIDSAKARLVEEEFARRIAEVPDRFREQTPAPGSKDAIMRGIADLQRGTPNYERMSAALAAKIRRDASQLQAMFVSLGAVESIFFRGVGPGGYDIYGVKFAGGSAEFRLLLGADGKAADVIFRPDGNDEPGGVAACSSEPGLRSQGGNAPVKVLFYNNTGDDIQLYGLDSKGIRTAHGTIGDNMSSSVMTYVDNPWVITDRTGQCLEIVLPGQRTRYHTVETPRAGGSRAVPPRTTPQAGSEERLREHIEALGRGQPNYDRMTSEVAEQTRRQLALDQAILARLGALRAVSFRGVSALGSDVYIAHFANGSAEWRIGLVRDGSIGRIALGPQY